MRSILYNYYFNYIFLNFIWNVAYQFSFAEFLRLYTFAKKVVCSYKQTTKTNEVPVIKSLEKNKTMVKPIKNMSEFLFGVLLSHLNILMRLFFNSAIEKRIKIWKVEFVSNFITQDPLVLYVFITNLKKIPSGISFSFHIVSYYWISLIFISC